MLLLLLLSSLTCYICGSRYFTDVGYSTVETVLPPVVSFLSQQRKAIGNALGKAVRSKGNQPTAKQTVPWSEFQHVLEVGWGKAESGLTWGDDFWSSARALADPLNTGQVEYKPLLTRCHFRENMARTCDSRKTGRMARTKLPRASAIAKRVRQ